MGEFLEFFKIEHWTRLGVPTVWAWAIVGALIVVWIAYSIGKSDGNQENRSIIDHKDFLEAQLRLARNQIAGEAKAIGDLKIKILELEKLLTTKASVTVVEPILKAMQSTANRLATINTNAQHIVSAEDTEGLPLKKTNNRKRKNEKSKGGNENSGSR